MSFLQLVLSFDKTIKEIILLWRICQFDRYRNNIYNHKLDRSDQKANTNTSPEMKTSGNVKQGTSLVKNSTKKLIPILYQK